MADEIAPESQVARIGHTAGKIWHTLNREGPLSFARLVKMIDEPRDIVMQGLGWLAREDKLRVTEEGRSRIVALNE